MQISLDCPRCHGTVTVDTAPRRGKRVRGTCAACGSTFSFAGGVLTYVDPASRRWNPASWRFRQLVEEERQRVLEPADEPAEPEPS